MRIRKQTLRRIERLLAVVQAIVLIGAGTPQPVRGRSIATSPVLDPVVAAAVATSDSVTPVELRSLPQVPLRPQPVARRTLWVTVTAYSSTVDQTDGDPFTTASGEKVRDGIIAWNNVPFGTKVRLPDKFGDKIFVVKDRLNPRASRYHLDIWMPTREAAKQWGARVVKVEIL